MKKKIFFVCSFIVLYLGIELISGFALTLLYAPDLSGAFGNVAHLQSEVVITSTPGLSPLILALLALGLAYGATKLFRLKESY
ncbi:hypothetical protein [Aureibacillus halotolerans]|uniref:Uncharacterized protein n=1 Tax=Aureibacillus halotolerans TaxID=1508390 RepID=A0A4R6TV98_9BACI|nr:hypothetical protein [Aureibacillus halotolerans]TDQ36582.1 hypothetical protein EV213_11746 [Aureibacillus halotolerans]